MQNIPTMHLNALIEKLPDFPTLPMPSWPKWQRLSWMQLISLVIVAALLLPMVYLLMRALGAGQEGLEYLLRERTLTIILNSLSLTAAVTLSTVLIGVPFAWLTTRTDLPLRRMWLVLGLLTMVIPSYLGAVAYLAAFGPKGMLQEALLPLGVDRLPDIRGFFGAWLSITLFTYPYIVLPVRAALMNMDGSLEDAARSLGYKRWQVFFRVTLPQLRPALLVGMLLTALYTLSDFGAVAVMRFNAFTRAIYLQYNNSFNASTAAILALTLVALTLGLLWLEKRASTTARNYRIGTGAQRSCKKVKLGRWRIPALFFCFMIVAVGVMIPVMVMLAWALNSGSTRGISINLGEVTANTVSAGGITALVALLLALPPALLAARTSSKFNRWLVGLAYTGNVLPGIVVALALVFFAAHYLPDLYRTLPVLILGYTMRFLPYSLASTRSALTQINPRLEEAARSLGLSAFRANLRVTLPLARGGILAGAALVFLSVLKELPTTLILAPAGYRSLAGRIWSSYEDAMLALAGWPGLILMAASIVALLILLWRDRWRDLG